MHPLSRHQACAYNGKVYVFGGFDGISKFNNLSIYDVETKKWSFPAVLGGATPKPRSNHACAVVGDKLCATHPRPSWRLLWSQLTSSSW